VLVTVEYKIDPVKAQQFLEAIHKYQRIRRRDGATGWGVYYDSESSGLCRDLPRRFLGGTPAPT
jgi:hypothetical protein